MPNVDAIKTKPAPAAWLQAATDAFASVAGTPPNAAQLALLWGHFDLLTNGGENVKNHNVGGITAGGSKNAQVITGTNLRAYPNLYQGTRDALAHLMLDDPKAWAELIKPAPDPAVYVQALRSAQGLSQIAKRAQNFAGKFAPQIAKGLPGTTPPRTPRKVPDAVAKRLAALNPTPAPSPAPSK